MLNAKNKYIKNITNSDQYEDFQQSCLQRGNEIYITRNALHNGMMKYSDDFININKIIRHLEDECILERGVDSITKKFKNKRHYVTFLPNLKQYLKRISKVGKEHLYTDVISC